MFGNCFIGLKGYVDKVRKNKKITAFFLWMIQIFEKESSTGKCYVIEKASMHAANNQYACIP